MSNYVVETVDALLNDDFVTVPKILAAAVGLDEAVIVKQIWAWCKHNQKRKDKQHFKNGHYWTYNSYGEWLSEFPWMSKRTIQRKILKLEKQGILVSDRHKAVQNDQTKWYRIDPDVLFKFYKLIKNGTIENAEVAPSTRGQSGMDDSAKMARSRECQNGTMSYKKNNAENRNKNRVAIASEDCPLGASSYANAQSEINPIAEPEAAVERTANDRLVERAAEQLAAFFGGRLVDVSEKEPDRETEAVENEQVIASGVYVLPSGNELDLAWTAPAFQWLIQHGYTPEINESATLDDGFEVYEPMYFDPACKEWRLIDLSWQKSNQESVGKADRVHLAKLAICLREYKQQLLINATTRTPIG